MSAPLVFSLNGERIELAPGSVDPGMSLNEYIRRHSRFTGTKLSCGEGGCGACAVDLARVDPGTNRLTHMSVNSCLRPLASVDGYSVTTTEGLGNSQTGFHPIHERIAGFNGSQCGYCTPGMVMTLYSSLKQNPKLTMAEVEARFDGNICRCTGYRPILDAAKSFAIDSNVVDMVNKTQKSGAYDSQVDPKTPLWVRKHSAQPLHFQAEGLEWHRPTSLIGLWDILESNERANVRLVVGGTSVGIYKQQKQHVLVDVSAIPELVGRSSSVGSVNAGASVTIHQFMELLQASKEGDDDSDRVAAIDALVAHAGKVANVHVRHAGSIAGNLVMAKSLGFLSDLATILLGADATVTLACRSGHRVVSMPDFLASPSFEKGEIVLSVSVEFPKGIRYSSYKTALRPQNSHAYINAAFGCLLEGSVVKNPILAFGGVLKEDVSGSHAIRAKQTEEYLSGKSLTKETLDGAIRILKEELVPENSFRHRLVTGFFYKYFVSLSADASAKVSSAKDDTTVRSATKSSQAYTLPEKSNGPVSKATEKLSAKLQAAGEAKYMDDQPMHANGLFAAIVTSTIGRGEITDIDASKALQAPGVKGFLSAADVPGNNNYNVMGTENEEIFAEKKIQYHGQPVGLILADTERHARDAAALVDVTYTPHGKRVVQTIQQALEEHETYVTPVRTEYKNGDVEEELKKGEMRSQGSVKVGTQKHFYMETQAAYAYPDENGSVVVNVSNQWPDAVQGVVARALGVSVGKVKIVFRRAGGAFGGKLTHASLFACMAAVACRTVGVPVRLVLDRNTDMKIAGGREETEVSFDVAFNKEGKISALKIDGHLNAGFSVSLSGFTNVSFPSALNQVYDVPSFLYGSTVVRSNLPSRTVVRGPGEISASYVIESVMEHVANQLKDKSSAQVREINFYVPPEGDEKILAPNGHPLTHYSIPQLWKELKEKHNYDERVKVVEEFNRNNRWKKKGLAATPVRYDVNVFAKSALVNIYGDGSVIVSHSACEMGQGLDTKVAQMVSYALGQVFGDSKGIDLELIRLGDTDTTITPNAMFTGGSTGSEGTAEAARRACATLVERMKPTLSHLQAKKEEQKDATPVSWPELCAAAKNGAVNLSVVDHWSGAGDSTLSYMNYGAAISEVLVDVLTGETKIIETDIIYDCGVSLNPAIDIGQAEGAFMMGVGHILREKELTEDDGNLVSNGTWEYKPPCVKDVPETFNVELLNNPNFDKGILSSKSSGEPPLVLACSVGCAVRNAISSAREDAGLPATFDLSIPMAPSDIQEACGTTESQFTL